MYIYVVFSAKSQKNKITNVLLISFSQLWRKKERKQNNKENNRVQDRGLAANFKSFIHIFLQEQNYSVKKNKIKTKKHSKNVFTFEKLPLLDKDKRSKFVRRARSRFQKKERKRVEGGSDCCARV